MPRHSGRSTRLGGHTGSPHVATEPSGGPRRLLGAGDGLVGVARDPRVLSGRSARQPGRVRRRYSTQAAAPSGDGACGRTPAGCGGRRVSGRLRGRALPRPAADGGRPRPPARTGRAGRRSRERRRRSRRPPQYMKYRSSSRPPRPRHRRGPNEETGGGHPIDLTHTRRLCLQLRGRRQPDEQFLAQFGERPDHTGRTKARVDRSRRRFSDRQRPRQAARAMRRQACRSRRRARWCRCSRAAPVRSKSPRIPVLLALEKPTLRSRAMTRMSGHPVRTASTLPSLDALSTTTISCGMRGGCWRSEQMRPSRSAFVLWLTMMIARSVTPPTPGRPAFRRRHGATSNARRHQVRRPIPRAGRFRRTTRIERAGNGRLIAVPDEHRRIAAHLARDIGVEEHRRHARAQRFEGWQAEAFIFRQKRERPRAAVKRRELGVGHVVANRHLRSKTLGRDDSREILVRVRAVLADDLEPCVSMPLRDRLEGANEIRKVTTVQDRADEEHERIALRR